MYVINPKTVSSFLTDKIRRALEKVQINCLFAYAVLDLKVDGIIAVNSMKSPESFYIRHPYGMSLLFGNTDNQEFTKTLWQKRLEENWRDEYLQVYPNSDLNNRFLPSYCTSILERVNFKFNKVIYETNKIDNATSFAIVNLSKQMFNDIEGTVVPNKFWRNAIEFQNTALGKTIFHKGKLVATAFAAFIHNKYFELGIETKPEHRGKNLAYLCCSALIDYCLQYDFEPVWSCRKDNVGSFKLAQKLGFEPTITIPYYKLK